MTVRLSVLMTAVAMMFGGPALSTAPDAAALRDEAQRAIAAGEWRAAHDALAAYLDARPNDRDALYDLAAVVAQQGEPDHAVERLVQAIQHGFIDIHKLERDARFDPVRTTPEYKAIIAGWPRLLEARADANEEAVRKLLGAEYRFERDVELRLIYASSFHPESFDLARSEIADIANWAHANAFPPATPEESERDAWVTVMLPKPEHFLAFMLQLGAGPNIGGFYDHDRSQLICQDIGPSLRHEFLHVLHWRVMTRLGQSHPDWIMEGLGALVEDMDPDAAAPGGLRPAPSWRTNIAKRLNKLGRLHALDELTTMDRGVFRGRRPNANYAQARAVMLFLYERGELGPFLRTYFDTYAKDPSGRAALELATGRSVGELDTEYRAWLVELPEAPEEISPGMASLGVTVSAGKGDGPVIDEIVAGTAAGRSGLRMRDVILSIDGRATRTLPDLVRVLSSYDVGDVVEVAVRRGSRHLTLQVELQAR